MTAILAVDPGPMRSAWLILDASSYSVRRFGIGDNDELLAMLRGDGMPDLVTLNVETVVIERVEGFGMPVGVEVFETVFWTGRFAEAAHPVPVERIGRKAVKVHLCGSLRAKDPNVRQALLDRYGGAAAKGTKAHPGPLYGISADLWSALAVGITWADLAAERQSA